MVTKPRPPNSSVSFPDVQNLDILEVLGTEATKGELHSEITLVVDGGEGIAIHTSCSKPIEIGDVHGDFVIDDLDKIAKEGGKKDEVSAEALACAESAIERLVRVDRILAETLIVEVSGLVAVDPANQDKVDGEVVKALDELAKSDADWAAGSPDKAIQHYRKAWEHATHAIKEAAKEPKAPKAPKPKK
ncbi:hypothetical protein ACFLVC_00320 [Chloroflexota bacterium]